MELYIITFKHGNYTIAAYSNLEKYKLTNIKLSQTPFSIKSECDLCLKTKDLETLKLIIRECRGKFPIDNVYSTIKQNGLLVYKLLPLTFD